jgi:hypothetical protein
MQGLTENWKDKAVERGMRAQARHQVQKADKREGPEQHPDAEVQLLHPWHASNSSAGAGLLRRQEAVAKVEAIRPAFLHDTQQDESMQDSELRRHTPGHPRQ